MGKIYTEIVASSGRIKIECDSVAVHLKEGAYPSAMLRLRNPDTGELPANLSFLPYARPSRTGYAGRIMRGEILYGYVSLDGASLIEPEEIGETPIEYASRSFRWEDVSIEDLRRCGVAAGIDTTVVRDREALVGRLKAMEFDPFAHGIDFPEEAYGSSSAVEEMPEVVEERDEE